MFTFCDVLHETKQTNNRLSRVRSTEWISSLTCNLLNRLRICIEEIVFPSKKTLDVKLRVVFVRDHAAEIKIKMLKLSIKWNLSFEKNICTVKIK